MCFSLPREFAAVVGEFCCRDDTISTGAVGGDRDSSESSESSDDSESTLLDSSGMSFRLGLGHAISIAGVVANCGCVSQQSVSRFQMRQLRFSRRRPFSIESAHFEKTERPVSNLHWSVAQDVCSPLHMPNRFSTFLVSTSRILPASIESIGFSNLTGMFDSGRSSRARPKD